MLLFLCAFKHLAGRGNRAMRLFNSAVGVGVALPPTYGVSE